MTQKELLYYEDAIGHLDNINKLIDSFLSNITDDKLKTLLEEKKETNNNLRNNLNDLLVEVSHG